MPLFPEEQEYRKSMSAEQTLQANISWELFEAVQTRVHRKNNGSLRRNLRNRPDC